MKRIISEGFANTKQGPFWNYNSLVTLQVPGYLYLKKLDITILYVEVCGPAMWTLNVAGSHIQRFQLKWTGYIHTHRNS